MGFFGFPNCRSRYFSVYLTINHLILQKKNQNILSFQTVIVIKKVQTVLHVTINMENVTVIQTFQAKSVTNVLMVSMDSQKTVKVGFSYQYVFTWIFLQMVFA